MKKLKLELFKKKETEVQKKLKNVVGGYKTANPPLATCSGCNNEGGDADINNDGKITIIG